MRNTQRLVAALAGIGLAASLSACSSEDTAEVSAEYCQAVSGVSGGGRCRLASAGCPGCGGP